MSDYSNPGGGVTYSPPNSTMAIVSLISGILGLSFIPLVGSIAALITGYMAKKEIQESSGTIEGDGLATVGIVLGWIGVALGVAGLCLVGVIIAIPACFIPWGVIRDSSSYWIAPLLLGLF